MAVILNRSPCSESASKMGLCQANSHIPRIGRLTSGKVKPFGNCGTAVPVMPSLLGRLVHAGRRILPPGAREPLISKCHPQCPISPISHRTIFRAFFDGGCRFRLEPSCWGFNSEHFCEANNSGTRMVKFAACMASKVHRRSISLWSHR